MTSNPTDLRKLRYDENVRAPTWAILLFGLVLGVGAGLVTAVAVRSLVGNPLIEGASAVIFYIAVGFVTLLDLFIMLNFTNLLVSVSEQSLEVRFGMFSTTIAAPAIRSVEVAEYRWLTYGGWGIRLSTGGRRAWSMFGTAGGVLIDMSTDEKPSSVFVSSREPEKLAAALRGIVAVG